ncbi:hypothetical protein ACLKA7_001931 [Drosophila subpalustris]
MLSVLHREPPTYRALITAVVAKPLQVAPKAPMTRQELSEVEVHLPVLSFEPSCEIRDKLVCPAAFRGVVPRILPPPDTALPGIGAYIS